MCLKNVLQRYVAVFVVVTAASSLHVLQIHAYYTNMPASVVIGQPDFFSNAPNNGGISASTISNPGRLFSDGVHLFVPDINNHRVLIWNSIPIGDFQPADVVLGQPDFTSSTANNGGASANTLNAPNSVFSDGSKLYVTDGSNHRVLIWNSIPTRNQQPADVVVGQPDFTTITSGISATKLVNPADVMSYEGKLLVSQSSAPRVAIWNSIPTTNGAPADVAVGQDDLSSSATGTAANRFAQARSIAVAEGKLFVADFTNHRIMAWNSIPTSSGAPADFVLGQPNFTSNAAYNGVISCATFGAPDGVWTISGGRRLIIGDSYREIIFNSIPSTTLQSGDIVLGQPDCSQSETNNGGLSSRSLAGTDRKAFEAGNKLILSDGGNNRVLIYTNEFPDVLLNRTVIGQPNGKLRFSGTMSTNVPNQVVKQVEYSVNGSSWTGGFPTDGQFDAASEGYFFDFDPSINRMADNQGYTVKIRATHDNDKDVGSTTLYFEPFQADSPLNNTFTLNRLPSFTFTIQKFRFSDLKENLDHFRMMVKRDGGDWQPYLDFIPVDYNSVRLHPDNLNPNQVDTMNGTYEDRFKVVTYTQDNSVIAVQPKAVDGLGNASDKYWENGGKLFSNGNYQWKVQAYDHAGQLQETEPKTLRIGTRQVLTTRPYFPLIITGMGGTKGAVHLSTDYLQGFRDAVMLTTRTPMFSGIAVVGSTVTFHLTDRSCTSSDPLLCTAIPQCQNG